VQPHLAEGSAEELWCPVTAAAAVLGRRWQLVLVDRLMGGGKRFNEIKELIPGISSKVLSETLRDMEEDGLVERTVTAGPPIHVTYSLTRKGRELNHVLRDFRAWGEKWMSHRPHNITQKR
jgi:DNA-binding HxlR family transcriptional regulator